MLHQKWFHIILHSCYQKYSRLRWLLCVKGLICFYLCWSGSILHFRQNICNKGRFKVTWPLTRSKSQPSYAALKRELTFCNGYLSLLYFLLLWNVMWLTRWKQIICMNAISLECNSFNKSKWIHNGLKSFLKKCLYFHELGFSCDIFLRL